MAHIAINIVTHNSAERIDRCLESVARQDYTDYQVTVVDNNSRDGTLDRLALWRARSVAVIANPRNLYYSRAHNQAIDRTASELVLTLNPDVVIDPRYLSAVVQAFAGSPQLGSVNGKLLLPPVAGLTPDIFDRPPAPDALLDSAGLLMYRSRRPYLRGNRRPARAHCLEARPIFGADGACAAYRRSMLRDVALDGEYFDNDFVIYREDVDLAWRAQLFGWDSIYVPEALGYHIRGFHLARDRRAIAPLLKRHSVKNGWLLLVKNDSPAALARHLPWVLPYQAKIAAGLLTVERTSLGAVADTARLLPKMWRKRRAIARKRRRPWSALARWFE